MEIFNLENEPEEKPAQNLKKTLKNQNIDDIKEITDPSNDVNIYSDTDEAVFVISDMKPGVKNPNRVNIFLTKLRSESPQRNPDDPIPKRKPERSKFAFSLDLAEVVDEKLKIGQKLSDKDISRLKKVSSFGKFYQRALEWTLTRPRSEREVRDHLREFAYKKRSDEKFLCDKNDIDEIVEKLKSKHYLDDRKFAEFYVENRFVKKGISKKRLRLELVKKGIDKEIIEDVLSSDVRDDAEEIRKIIVKKRAKYSDEKLLSYLVRQGFDYSLAQAQLARFSETD